MSSEIKAFAPATVANVVVGFDILGFAIPILGDTVWIKKIERGVAIESITGIDGIPKDPARNTAGFALIKLIEGENIDFGFSIRIDKGIPLGSGLGGSAASAVAAVVAANEFLDPKLNRDELLKYALYGESVASGSIHGDNVAASLFGGLTICTNFGSKVDDFQVTNLPIPDVYLAIAHPHLVIKTEYARQVINPVIELSQHTELSMRLAKFISMCYSQENDYSQILEDNVIEPQRIHLIPKFELLKKTALDLGAEAFSISGAGPTVFAWCSSADISGKIIKNWIELDLSYNLDVWSCSIDEKGAHVL